MQITVPPPAPNPPFIAIDFEASCLPRHGRSYPIEVGIADAQGRSRSWLIRPSSAWLSWDWTAEAERIHGITKLELERYGQPPELVAHELRQVLTGQRVFADSHIDTYWCDTLANVAGVTPIANIEHVDVLFDEFGAISEDIFAAIDVLELQPFKRHRAGEDARWLSALIESVAQTSAVKKNLSGQIEDRNGRLGYQHPSSAANSSAGQLKTA